MPYPTRSGVMALLHQGRWTLEESRFLCSLLPLLQRPERIKARDAQRFCAMYCELKAHFQSLYPWLYEGAQYDCDCDHPPCAVRYAA